MSNIPQWSPTAANNNDPSPDGAAEGMQYSSVNNVIREMMAAISREYLDTNGTLTAVSSGNNYAVTTNSNVQSLVAGDSLSFIPDSTNTDDATLSRDGLAAVPIRISINEALRAGELQAGVRYDATYNGSFYLINYSPNSSALLDRLPATVTGSKPVETRIEENLTLTAEMMEKYLRFTSANPVTLTLPSVIAINREVDIRQAGVGVITFNPDTGVTINAPASGSLTTSGQGDLVRLKKVAASEWDIIGASAAASTPTPTRSPFELELPSGAQATLSPDLRTVLGNPGGTVANAEGGPIDPFSPIYFEIGVSGTLTRTGSDTVGLRQSTDLSSSDLRWGQFGVIQSAGVNGFFINNSAYEFNEGDVLMMALNKSTRQLWLGRNGTWFSGSNPAAGTGEIVTLSSDFLIDDTVLRLNVLDGAEMRVLNSDELVFTPPAGFNS